MTEPPAALHRHDLDPDPVSQFRAWSETARRQGLPQPDAAALATATRDGVPSVRMVLVKTVAQAGCLFFTNYDSRKGAELTENPRAALLFYWDPPGRQVRIEGPVAITTPEESLAYARSRHRLSQLSALASPQSRPVQSRERLEELVAELADRHAGEEVPLSSRWGGFRLTPRSFEFWQAGRDRLHDRFLYTPAPAGGWQIDRLAP